jgi:hypothetical protein
VTIDQADRATHGTCTHCGYPSERYLWPPDGMVEELLCAKCFAEYEDDE